MKIKLPPLVNDPEMNELFLDAAYLKERDVSEFSQDTVQLIDELLRSDNSAIIDNIRTYAVHLDAVYPNHPEELKGLHDRIFNILLADQRQQSMKRKDTLSTPAEQHEVTHYQF